MTTETYRQLPSTGVDSTAEIRGENLITIADGRGQIYAPAPPALDGTLLIQRVHAYRPWGLDRKSNTGELWFARLRRRYPTGIRKVWNYVGEEGPLQTLEKVRSRSTLERFSTAYGYFSLSGLVVENRSDKPLDPGQPVVSWGYHGASDADFRLVRPEQVLPTPFTHPTLAAVPYLGCILEFLEMHPDFSNVRATGLRASIAAILPDVLKPQLNPAGGRLVALVGDSSEAVEGETTLRISSSRRGPGLLRFEEGEWRCSLPDPAHYFIDPYGPVELEHPNPFSGSGVAKALAQLLPHVEDGGSPPPLKKLPVRTVALRRKKAKSNSVGVSCLGAGNFSRVVLVHMLRTRMTMNVRGIMDIRPEIAAVQGRAMDANFCTTDPAAVFEDENTDLVLIASDHASHADYAIRAIEAGKMLHIEKPPAVSWDQFERLLETIDAYKPPMLHIGYNRPFAPAFQALNEELQSLDGPTFVSFIIKGHYLNRAHWYNWPTQGTRIAGNFVHWIDLGYRLTGWQSPTWVDVTTAERESEENWDATVMNIGYKDGSLCSLSFCAAGDETFGIQEYTDVKRQGLSARIDNFSEMEMVVDGRRTHRRFGRDKGHKGEMDALAAYATAGRGNPSVLHDLIVTTAIQLAGQKALAQGGGRVPVELERVERYLINPERS